MSTPDTAAVPGTMTLLGYDYEKQVYHWQDDADKSIWRTAQGKKYGYLSPFARRPDGASEAVVIPADQRRGYLYLLNPHHEEYRPAPNGRARVVDLSTGSEIMNTALWLLRTVNPIVKQLEDLDIE